MSQTALAVIEKQLRGNEVMAKISNSLGKSATDPSVMKFLNGAIMYIQSKIGTKTDVSHCTPQSIIDSLINAATVRLPVDSKHYACLIAYGNTCTFQPEWRGYVAKVKEADPSAIVTVGMVFKGDIFTSSKTDNSATYSHKPANEFADDEKDIIGAYCFIKTDTGSYIEKMSKKELDTARASSKAGYAYIWQSWTIEMYKKTIIRRACKVKFTEAVAELDALDNQMFNDKPERVIPTISSESAPLPKEKDIQEAEVVHTTEPTAEELIAKAEKAKAALHAEDKPKDAPEASQAPAIEDKQLSAKGIVSAHFPPKGKGPHSFKVGDFQDYLKTFDKDIAENLINHKENGDEVEVTYEWVSKGDFTNAMITGVSVQNDAQE